MSDILAIAGVGRKNTGDTKKTGTFENPNKN